MSEQSKGKAPEIKEEPSDDTRVELPEDTVDLRRCTWTAEGENGFHCMKPSFQSKQVKSFTRLMFEHFGQYWNKNLPLQLHFECPFSKAVAGCAYHYNNLEEFDKHLVDVHGLPRTFKVVAVDLTRPLYRISGRGHCDIVWELVRPYEIAVRHQYDGRPRDFQKAEELPYRTGPSLTRKNTPRQRAYHGRVFKPKVPKPEASETAAIKIETPETEVPITDVPMTEAIRTETPETAAIKIETPETEVPITDIPMTEVPMTEVPTIEASQTQASETQIPKAQKSKSQKPKGKKSKAQTSKDKSKS